MKKIIYLLMSAIFLFSFTMPTNAIPHGGSIPSAYWAVYAPYERARNANDSAAVARYVRPVIDFWLNRASVTTVEQLAAQLSTDVVGNGFIITSIWSAAYNSIPHFERIGDRQGQLWAVNAALAILDVTQKLAPYIGWTASDLDFSRILLQNMHAGLDISISIFAEVTDDYGQTAFFGALHEPRTGVFFGEQAAHLAVMNGAQSPSALSIYVEFEIENMQARVSYDLGTHERMHGVNRNELSIIQIAWNFMNEGNTPPTVRSQEAMIVEAAQFLGQTELPILLRVGGEVDVWSTQANPQEFIDAFRFIANIMRREAPNVAMVYSVNAVSAQGVNWMTFYPGDNYVDWVGISLYSLRYFMGNPNTTDGQAAIYRTGRFANPIAVMAELVEMFGDRKPILISEGGVTLRNRSNNEDTTQWALPIIRQIYSYIPMLFPQVKAIFWFNVHKPNEAQWFDFNQSPAARALYTELTASPYFLGLGMTSSPITFRNLSNGLTTLPANNVTLQTFAPFFTIENVQVRYLLNGRQIGTSTTIPYRQTLSLSNERDGNHTLRVEVIADGRILQYEEFNVLKTGNTVVIGGAPSQPRLQAGDFLGNVLNTDIRVFIDGAEIRGYNINGWTFVIAEDLRAYGFDVHWNPTALSLSITRGPSTETPRPVPTNIMPSGSIAFPYVHTDIVTYINGQRVNSYNIRGFTVVQIDDIAATFGQLVWDPVNDQVIVTLN